MTEEQAYYEAWQARNEYPPQRIAHDAAEEVKAAREQSQWKKHEKLILELAEIILRLKAK
jgi:hypothetical protein